MSTSRMIRSLLLPALQRSASRPFSSFASTSSSSSSCSSSFFSVLQPRATTLANATRAYATEASHLGNLYPAPGSSRSKKRIGRGIGSGRGGTSGRGHKGQGARSGNGKPALHFAGGQTPITRAFPKRGFTNPLRQEMTPLNLDRLQHWIDRGLIDPTAPITMKELFETRCVHGIKHGVKLLGDGKETFRTPGVHLTVSKASSSAIAAIENLSGTLVARYENRLTLRALINPTSFARKGLKLPGKANPIGRTDLLYYGDIKNRGYLALAANIPIPGHAATAQVIETRTVVEEESMTAAV